MNLRNPDNWKPIWFWCLALVVATLFAPKNFQALALIPLSLVTFIRMLQAPRAFFKQVRVLPFAGLWLLFFLIALAGLYSSNTQEAGQVVVRNLSLLFFPFVLAPVTELSRSKRLRLFWVFQFSLVLAASLCLGRALIHHVQTGSAFTPANATHFVYNNYMSHLLTDPLGLHPIYLSFFVTVASVALVVFLLNSFSQLSPGKKVGLILLLVFHMVLIWLLKSAVFTLLYALSMVLTLGLYFYFSGRLSTGKKWAITGIAAVGLVLAGFGSWQKIESINTDFELSDPHLKPLNMRLAIWQCTIPLIQEHPWKGVGSGDQMDRLYQSFEEKGFYIALHREYRFNTHNQYLQFWLGQGVLAVLAYLFVLGFNVVQAVRQKNLVHLAFVFCLIVFGITESNLQTQTGILFTVLFLCVFNYLPSFWNFASWADRDKE